MGASKFTPNLDLPIFEDDDKPTWRGDINDSHYKLDKGFATLSGKLNDDKVQTDADINAVKKSIDATSKTVDAIKPAGGVRAVGRGEIVLSINDYDPDPNNIASVLDQAIADANATRRLVRLGKGVWKTAKAGRHSFKSYTGIQGDDSGSTVLQFTHRDGGLDFQDTGGSYKTYTYENKIKNIILEGGNVCNTLVTATNIEECDLTNVRVQNWLDVAFSFDTPSLITTRVIEASSNPNNPRPVFRLAGKTGTIVFDSPNWYNTAGVEIVGSLSHLRFVGLPWFEGCPDIVTVNTPTAISVGQVHVTGHILNVGAKQSVFRIQNIDPGSSVTGVKLHDALVNAASSTSPLFDFSSYAMTGTVGVEARDSTVMVKADNPGVVGTHPNQTWYTFHADLKRLMKSPGVPLDSTKTTPASGYNTGGYYAKPVDTSGSGSPVGAVTAPPGSIYRNLSPNTSAPALWAKATSGVDNAGWIPLSMMSGTTRPAAPMPNQVFFDLSLTPARPIVHTGNGRWIDYAGNVV